MSFRIGWDYPALALFADIPWPTSADVDAAVQRFARERAPALASGTYGVRASGYTLRMQVDRNAGTVLVLYLYRRR
jgi:hypothetical protein